MINDLFNFCILTIKSYIFEKIIYFYFKKNGIIILLFHKFFVVCYIHITATAVRMITIKKDIFF